MDREKYIRERIKELRYHMETYSNFVAPSDIRDGYSISEMEKELQELYRELRNPEKSV